MIFDLIAGMSAAAAAPSGGGQFVATAAGSWVVPEGVFSISAVMVALQASGGGGGLSYSNDIPVTPGETLTYSFAANVNGSRLLRGTTVLLKAVPATVTISEAVGDVKFAGGLAGSGFGAGGGAGGYAGNGGAGGVGSAGTNGSPGSGGGGGGGFSGTSTANAGGGGGVGLLGIGSSGTGGTSASPGGVGGSGGNNGSPARVGGNYGGGGVGAPASTGALRIMWGAGRSYPNNAADV